MKNLLKIRLLLLLPVLLISVDMFARAGGGGSIGGGGGNFKLIGFIITIIYSIVISIVLFIKIKKSPETVDQVSENDLSWDYDELRHHAKKTFLKMQDAWMFRNIDAVKEIITENLYDDYKVQLEEMKKNNEMNVLSSIEVKKIRIIGCEDYMEDSHDRFIAHIHGEMIDYTIDEVTGDVIDNSTMETQDFTDTYHFIRKDKEWVLDYIDNFVTNFDVIRTKNHQEHKNSTHTTPHPVPHIILPMKMTSKNLAH
ncbi:MAG TPA: Tim44-like domain-containing protein [Paludibacter sp.]